MTNALFIKRLSALVPFCVLDAIALIAAAQTLGSLSRERSYY